VIGIVEVHVLENELQIFSFEVRDEVRELNKLFLSITAKLDPPE
jgi:hypothetical protein